MSGALVLQRGPLTQQPQQAVPLTTSVTKAPSLVVSGYAGAQFLPQSSTLANFTQGQNGVGFASTGAASGLAWTTAANSPVSGAQARTMFARVTINANNGNTSLLAIGSSVNNCLFSFELYNGSIILHWYGGYVTVVSSVVAGATYDLAGTYDGATVRGYVGGKFVASSAVALTTTASALFVGGSGDYFPTATNATLYAAGVIARCLTDAEIAQISANPWQVFQAPRRRLWLAVNNSGTNGNATPVGVSAASAVGSLIAAGYATATPSGVQASSAVGVPAATGDANTTPSGVSATSAVGSPSASAGTNATASPAGVSAASSVGSPVATGGASALPTGVSSVSAIGSPTATGDASVTPAGVAAASAVGNVTASGPVSATAYPQGVQATTAVGVPTFGKTDTADGVSRGGNTKWRGWDEKAWRKRHVRDEIAADVREAWQGLKAAPEPVKEELPAPVKPIIEAKRLEPQQLDLSEVKALMAAWEAEQKRRDDEEEEDLIALLQL
jgi:hypothetical protein